MRIRVKPGSKIWDESVVTVHLSKDTRRCIHERERDAVSEHIFTLNTRAQYIYIYSIVNVKQ